MVECGMSKKLSVHSDDGGGYSPPSYYKEAPAAVIDIANEESLRKWEAVLEMSRVELLDAIKDFGPVLRDIRRGLRRSRDDAA